MSNPLVPNFKKGVGRLATDRFDFENHVEGLNFRHKANQIDLFPTVIIGVPQTNVQSAIEALSTIVVSAAPDATTISKGIIQLTGDISGTATNIIVKGIFNRPITNTPPNTNDVLTWNGSSWIANAPSGSGFVAGGDLTGSATNQNVVKAHGATIPIAGALITGNVLQVSAISDLSYGPVNLAGGSNYVSGLLPTGNQAAQTMGGDVSGTTASATVVQARGLKSATTTVSVDAATAPSVGQVLTATSSTTATWQTGSGGGSGITQLTGDVIAGPGSGSVASTVLSLTGAGGLVTVPVNTVIGFGSTYATTGGILKFPKDITAVIFRNGNNTTNIGAVSYISNNVVLGDSAGTGQTIVRGPSTGGSLSGTALQAGTTTYFYVDGATGASTFNSALTQFDAAVSSPLLTQAQSTGSTDGTTMTIRSQKGGSGVSKNSAGGNLIVAAGDATNTGGGGAVLGGSIQLHAGTGTGGGSNGILAIDNISSWGFTNGTGLTATSATAGANGAVPNQVAQYLIVAVNGTSYKIPLFNT